MDAEQAFGLYDSDKKRVALLVEAETPPQPRTTRAAAIFDAKNRGAGAVMRNKFAVVWIWLCLLPLAFDLRSVETASKAIDVLLTVTSMGAACAMLLIAPRFAPSQRAWVLTGSMVPVEPAVPASHGRDSDDR